MDVERSRVTRTRRHIRLLLGLVILLLATRLLFGENPWTSGLEERAAAGKVLRAKDFARAYGWWAALVLLPLTTALLATVGRWLTFGEATENTAFAPHRVRRGVASLVIAAMLVGAVLAGSRLSQSLFYDERESVMYAIEGYLHPAEGGNGLEIHRRRWVDTLYWYEMPNNHVVHSILARLCVSTWRLVPSSGPGLVSEVVLRLPAFIAGIAAIGAIGLLLTRLGRPAAAVVAAWMLALHPWHLRYASEARGYSLGLLGTAVLLMSFAAVLERGTWRRWIANGGVQLLLVWNHPSFAFLVAATNLIVAWELLRHRTQGTTQVQLTRCVVVNLFCVSLLVWLLAPLVPQYLAFSRLPTENFLDLARLLDVVAHYLTGAFFLEGTGDPHYWVLVDAVSASPLRAWGWMAATLGLAIVGTSVLLAAGGLSTMVAVLLIAPTFALGTLAWVTGANFFPQYLVGGLPGLVVVVSVGAARLTSRIPTPARVAVIACIVALFTMATHPMRRILTSRSVQPARESVALTRTGLAPTDPANEDIVTLSFDFPTPRYYDPRVRNIKSEEELREQIAEADARGHRLFVNGAQLRTDRRWHLVLTEILEDPDLFEDLGRLPGLRPRYERRVWRYRGREP